ncbi:MAG: acyltransferase family protein, partial [Pirellulaceae bacterium]
GLTVAMFLSVVKLITVGDPNESNYLPFFFGLNVLANDFPANPTTWYVGCYIHLLVAWAVIFRRMRPNFSTFIAIIAVEVLTRTVLLVAGRDYTAYMLITNWLLVFFLGKSVCRHHLERRQQKPATPGPSYSKAKIASLSTLGLVCVAFLWTYIVWHFGITTHNPFGRIPASSDFLTAFATACSVTALYGIYTLGVYGVTQALPRLPAIHFLAQHTLFVFLAHMPLIYWLSPWLYQYVLQGWGRVLCTQLLYFVVLAILSSILLRLIKLQPIKAALSARLFGHSN